MFFYVLIDFGYICTCSSAGHYVDEINIFPSNIVFLACMRYWTLDVSRTASYEITLFRLPSAIGQVFSRLKHKFFLTSNMMIADHDI